MPEHGKRDDYARYIEERYQGELFGEAVFAAMAEARRDPDEAHKLRVLARLERETGERLRPAVAEAGRPVAPDAERIAEARTLGAQMGQAPWRDFLAGMRPELVKFVADFERAEALAPPEGEALLRHVTAHERALLDFTDAELEQGASGDSLAPVRALLPDDD